MLSSQLRDELFAYVESRQGVGELEEWIVPRAHQLLRHPASADADAVATVELGLAEIVQGLETEATLRNTLADLLQREATVLIGGNVVITTGTASSHTAVSPHISIVNRSPAIQILGQR
jgi:hypothetical protein